ncbi:MAG: N-acetyltransferase [Muribaculaceae bacterium]|nr:N-acetyltransferase [Muribaculaceae bacterium]
MDFITEKDRIYATDASGNVIAEVTFPTKDGVSTIDHTFVDPSLRGEGIAGKLVKLAADKILSEGNKIAATCPYAVEWFKKHPEYNPICSGPAACRIVRRQ